MSLIDKPGVFDIPAEQYHGNCCAGPSLSASRLHTIIAECPAKFWETSPLNPNRVPDKTTPAFEFGRAAHALVLGEPEFNAHFVVAPFDDFRTKAAQAWRDAEARTVLKADAFETIKEMAAAQRRSPQCARAFENGKPEQSLIWRDKETGVWLKARPDWLPNNLKGAFLVDYKTALTIHPAKLATGAFQHGYHLQAAMQFDGAVEVFGVKPLGVAHVVQEKAVPYLAELKMFSPDHIEFGRAEYRRALRLFAECWKKHCAGAPLREAWPGFTKDPDYYETPRWVVAQMEGKDDGFDRQPGAERRYNAAEYLAAG